MTEGEDDLLAAQYKKMSHSRKIMESAGSAYALCANEASEAVSRALRELSSVEDYDETISGMKAQLYDADNLLNDFNREMAGYIDALTFDDEAFRETEQRLDMINTLKTKYGQTIREILDYKEQKHQELEQLEHYEEYLHKLRADFEAAGKTYMQLAKKVSEIRQAAGKKLSSLILEALKELNFLDVRFDMRFYTLENAGSNGIDEAEFVISTNPGEDLKPLGEVGLRR